MRFRPWSPIPSLFLTFLCAACGGVNGGAGGMDRTRLVPTYQIRADLAVVQRASAAVLVARGYRVSVQPGPVDDGEQAGAVVIGERTATLDATNSIPDASTDAATQAWVASQTAYVKDVVDISLVDNRRADNDLGAPMLTVVTIDGGVTTQTVTDPTPKEVLMGRTRRESLRDEIERQIEAWKNP